MMNGFPSLLNSQDATAEATSKNLSDSIPNETLLFLRHVLPAEGIYVACMKMQVGMRQFFSGSVEEQAKTILHWSAMGYDTYHACATYKTIGSRKRDNVHRVKSLWLDIDTREGKPNAPYENRLEAVQAVEEFCQKNRMQLPTLVNSGYGLHVYWVYDTPLPVDEWQAYADRLKARCHLCGLHADTARTADATSILRTPGTNNYKQIEL